MATENYNSTIVNASITGTTETVVAQLPVLSEMIPGAGGFLISGMVNLTPGTSATGMILRVRAGPLLTSPLLGQPDTTTVIAGSPQTIPFMAADGAPTVGNQYCLTVQPVAATAPTSVNDVNLILDAITPEF